MLVPVNTTIIIKSTPEAIWDYAYDPLNWTASNAEEHYGLKFDSTDNRPHTGTTFQQKESVAGIKAELRGHLPFVERPKIAFWRGIAPCRILLFSVRIPEGGVLTLEKTEGSTRLSHKVWMDFPDTPIGKIALWYFRRLNLEKAIYNHTFRELRFFKQQREKAT
ncbi:MAG: hypothetical protein NWE84_06865 [Candidatus Bathyarchaeota archaeon]|nr:hypothetical protein [Candidatus Bathyarchaeota archaeon]